MINMISILIPTYNEASNIKKLLPIINKDLKSRKPYEIIVIDDDSPDMTWKIAQKYDNVKVIRRIGVRGLGSAVIEGFKQSSGDIIGVIDADLSHPPELMKELIDECKNNDIVIASRYLSEGHSEMSLFRHIVSIIATFFARPLTRVRDPMSGYFFVRKSVLSNSVLSRLSPVGYKILLEILVKAKYKKVKEVPFVFGPRYQGKSKLGSKVYLSYILHLIKLYFYKIFN